MKNKNKFNSLVPKGIFESIVTPEQVLYDFKDEIGNLTYLISKEYDVSEDKAWEMLLDAIDL